MTELVKKTGTHFLVGSSEHAKFTGDPKDKTKTGNSALYFSPTGKILAQYLKIHLVPFGEYLPYQETIAWPDFIVPRNKYFEIPGKEYTLFDISESQFGVIICWEIVFSELFRTFVRNGADFMLNITNEGWFGAEALYQMVAISVFRAVENGVAIARAANTGVSCFIDPVGRITGRVINNGRDIFVKGYLMREVRLADTNTLYTLFGDFFAYFCILITAFSIAVALAKPKI
jgi:apolipoprotein N-acyltransferase